MQLVKPQTETELTEIEAPKMPFQDEGINVKTSVPTIDLEILVYGVKSDKHLIDAMNNDIYNQINTCKDGYGARIMYYIDNGEKTDEEKRQWLLENMKCRFYVFADNKTYRVEPDFVKKSLSAIIRLHKSFLHLKSKNIVKVPFKPTPQVPLAEEVTLEDLKEISESNE